MIRPALLLLAALAAAAPAGAQSLLGQSRPGGSPATPAPTPSAAPLAPVQVAPPQGAAPSGPQLQPGQFLPATPPAPGSLPAPAAAPAPSQAPVAPVQNEWLPQATAELRGIDKVTARTTSLTVKVGEAVRFGPFSVVVRSCLVRPPDRAPDAAGYLEVSEGSNPPLFRGWMILSQPQLAMVEHPTHDIRLFACRP